MKDRYFYPLAIIVIALIITLALKPGENTGGLTDAQVAAEGYTLDKAALERLTASPGTLLGFRDNALDKSFYAQISSNTPRDMAPPSAGVFATLGPQYERVFANKPLIVEVEARADKDAPLQAFDMGYFTAGAGDSGWKTYKLSDDFATYTLNFTPKASKEPGSDYVGIWPGVAGTGERMDVRAIRVRIKPEPSDLDTGAETDKAQPEKADTE